MYKDCSDILPLSYEFVIKNDRSLYDPFIVKLCEEIIKRGFIVGGKIGTMLILGNDDLIDQYSWELYVDTVDNVIELTNAIYNVKSEHIDSQTTVLSSIFNDHEYAIAINGRNLVKIYVLNSYKEIDIFATVPTLYGVPNVLTKFTQESNKMRYSPKELSLMITYHRLYHIGKGLEAIWTEALSTLKIYSGIKIGAGVPIDKLSKLVGIDDVVVGDYALNLLGLLHGPTKLQFITSTHMSEIVSRAQNIINRKGEKLTKNICKEITYMVHRLPIPGDVLFKKFSIKCDTGKYNDNIADIYNSTTYELIPYNIINNVKVGSFWVILRFIYIEMWILRVLSQASSKRYQELSGHADMVIRLAANSSSERLFPMNFVGQYLDENVIKKKLNTIESYYPATA
jgi:hypothetical protein